MMLAKYKNVIVFLILFGIICLSIAVYRNSLDNEFVNMDDLDLIVRNTYIKTLSFQNIKAIFTPGVVGAYQPVRTLSYAFDYHFWKLDPTGYHITNITCHALSTLLVFLIVYTMNAVDIRENSSSPLVGNAVDLRKNSPPNPLSWKERGDSFSPSLPKRGGRGVSSVYASIAALIFAVHPVHVEAVTWLSGRRDVLSSACALVSFYCFLRFLSGLFKSPRLLTMSFFYGLSLVFFALGLLTKPSIVVLPLLLVVYDVCFLPSVWRHWRRGTYYIPFFLFAAGFTRVFVSLSRASGVAKASYHGGDAYTTVLTMLRVFAEYIYMLFVPGNLSLTYGIRPVFSFRNPSLLLAVAVLLALLVLTILAWKKTRVLFFGICWFFICLLPVSNIIPIAIVKADRYLYLPSVGFCLVFAWLIIRGWKALSHLQKEQKISLAFLKKSVKVGYWIMIVIVLVSYALYTVRRNRDWKDSETLWTATLETTPDSPIALNNLGLIYTERGMYEKAIALYEQLLDYHPDQDRIERVYGNMARAYAGRQMFEEAIDYYQLSLEANPEYEDAYIGLGRVSMELGQYEKAAGIFRIALDLHPQSAAIYNQLGNVSFVQKNYGDAISSYQKALELNPLYIEAYNGLGLSYVGKGETDKALAAYQQALHLEPESAVIRNSLGSLYMFQGELEKAIAEFQASLKYSPDNAEVRHNLGLLFLRTERYEEALRELMAAVDLQPDNPKMLSNLGNAYASVGLYDEALLMYRQALEINPTLFRTHILLGDVCFVKQEYSCAIEAYQRALTLQPDNQEVLEKLQIAKEQQAVNR